MMTNVGTLDRAIRAALGLAALSTLAFDGNLRWIALLALPLLASATYGYCFAYTLLGVRTCSLAVEK